MIEVHAPQPYPHAPLVCKPSDVFIALPARKFFPCCDILRPVNDIHPLVFSPHFSLTSLFSRLTPSFSPSERCFPAPFLFSPFPGSAFSPKTLDYFSDFAYNNSDLRVRCVSGTRHPGACLTAAPVFFYKPFDFSAHFIYNDFANKAGAFRNHQPASTVRGRGLFLFLEMLFPLLDSPLIAQPFFDRLMLRFRKPVVCFRKITLIKRFIFFPALCLDLDPDQQL